MNRSTHWSQIGEAGVVWGMRVLLFCFRCFGRATFRFFLWPVIAYFFLRRRAARAASLDFLARVQPGSAAPATTWARYKTSFRHFLTFGELLLDKLAVWQGGFDGQVTMHGRSLLMSEIEAKRGAILLVSHLGNTEVCQSLAEHIGLTRINVLVHTEHAEKFNKLLAAKDSAARVNLVQVANVSPATAMLLEARLQLGEMVAIAADRTPLPSHSGAPIRHLSADFLGAPADFPQGPFILAALLKRPVYFLCAVKTGKHYDIYVEHLADRIDMNRRDRAASLVPAAQAYARRLEYYARRFPLQWGNFYDFWRRQ